MEGVIHANEKRWREDSPQQLATFLISFPLTLLEESQQGRT